MNETKNCKNCKKEFAITSDDKTYYQMIAVPHPTHCPACRLQRRMAWRNERFLHPRTCSAIGKQIISNFKADVQFPVYSREYWYSDKWDATTFGRDYDFSRDFFAQFADLQNVAPRLQMWLVNCINSDYSNYAVDSKDCYLCFTALGGNENCSYSGYLMGSIQCCDSYLINKCELCFECVNCDTCYGLRYGTDCKNCRDSWFLIDCTNCADCVGCVGLHDKQYCIANVQYSKEAYQEKLKSLDVSSRKSIAMLKANVEALAKTIPKRFMHGVKNVDVSGDYINNSKNVHGGYMVNNCEDAKNIYFCSNGKSLRDVTVSPLNNELIYECHAIPKSNYAIKCSELCANGCHDLEYCVSCDSSSDCFGCIGLRGKQYCILNKQYSKEEYVALKEKIIAQMKTQGEYGEFFPITLSPFPYNETLAQEYFPLDEARAKEKGYAWHDIEQRNYTPTIAAGSMPDRTSDITENIVKEIIECEDKRECSHGCTGAFRIIPTEFQTYQQLKIAPPTRCPNCRHHTRMPRKNPLTFWNRQCAKCNAAITTSYSSDRPEIVYCETCYQKEMIA